MREALMIGQKKGSFSAIVLIATAVFLMGYSFLMPEKAMSAAQNALSVFARSVLPSLFAFSVGAKLLIRSNFLSKLQGAARFFRALGMSSGGFSAFAIGAVSGFPTGAAVLSELCERGEIDEKEAASLLPFCNQAGASFVVGAVGVSVFESSTVGILFFVSQTAAALLALLMTAHTRIPHLRETIGAETKRPRLISAVTSSICESALAMLFVCGFIVFFSLCSAAVFDISEALGFSLPQIFRVLLGGALEISSGFSVLASASVSQEVAILLGGALLGLGSLSVFLQTVDRTERFFYQPRLYFLGKALTALLCASLSSLTFALYQWKNSVFLCLIVLAALVLAVFLTAKIPFRTKIRVLEDKN